MDYHDSVEEAEEVKPATESAFENDKDDEKLLDIEYDLKDILDLEGLDTNSSASKNGIIQSDAERKDLSQLFDSLVLDNNVPRDRREGDETKVDESLEEQESGLNIFDKSETNFSLSDLSSFKVQDEGEQSLQTLTSENMVLLTDILTDKQSVTNEWDALSNDTFLPPNILKQSLGDAALGVGQKSMSASNTDDKVSKN